jgi:hypothetical protein
MTPQVAGNTSSVHVSTIGRRNRYSLVFALLLSFGVFAVPADAGSIAYGPKGCQLLVNDPYRVIQPNAVAASVQLSCHQPRRRIRVTVVLYEWKRRKHRWVAIKEKVRAARQSTVIETFALHRCRAKEKPRYFAASAIGKVNGQMWSAPREANTKVKLRC